MTMTDQTKIPQPAFVDDIALQIADRALTAIRTATGITGTAPATLAALVQEACVAAYNAGRKHSDAEGELIQEAMDNLNSARARRLIESAVASVMEVAGTHVLHIDMRKAATVFERRVLTAKEVDGDVVYTLGYRKVDGADAS